MDTTSRPRPWVGLCLAFALAGLIAVPILQKELVGPFSRLVPLLVVVAAALAMLSSQRRNQFIKRISVPATFLLTYVVIATIATLINPAADGTWQALILTAVIGAAVLSMSLACDDRDRLVVVKAIVIMAIAEGIHGILESTAGIAPVWGYYYRQGEVAAGPTAFASEIFEGSIRGQGSLGHPLLLAYLLLVGLALVVGVRPWRKSLNVSIVCVLFAAMLATGSRSGIAVAGLLLLFSTGPRRNRVFLGVYGLATLLSFSIWLDFWSSGVVQRFTESGSLSHRSSSIGALGRIFEQDTIRLLIGNGINSTSRLYTSGLFTGTFFAVDNQFISAIAVTGILGAAAILGFLLWALKNGDTELRYAILVILATFVTFEVLVWPASYALMICIVGLAAPLRHPTEARALLHSGGPPSAIIEKIRST